MNELPNGAYGVHNHTDMEAQASEFAQMVKQHQGESYNQVQNFISGAYRDKDYQNEYKNHHNMIHNVFSELEGIQANTYNEHTSFVSQNEQLIQKAE